MNSSILKRRFLKLYNHGRNAILGKFPALYLQRSRRLLAEENLPNPKHKWEYRIKCILDCPDFHCLNIVQDAGRLKSGYQIMHNGLKVPLGSYYGPISAAVFEQTKGVHEPQEERLFADFLSRLSKKSATPMMIELGAYWGFYSAWFASQFPGGRNILIEPFWENLKFGLETFSLNGLKCESMRAYVGQEADLNGSLPTVSVPWLMEHYQVDILDLLHCDIQGFEYPMILGASSLLRDKRIRVLFLSTHNDKIHEDCQNILLENGYQVTVSILQRDSYAYDGLLIAARPEDVDLVDGLQFSRRTDKYPIDDRDWKTEV